MAELKTKIILRNDTSANWTSVASTVVLLQGEVGIEFDTVNNKTRMKIGDGTHTWAQLPYFGGNEVKIYQVECALGADKLAALTAEVGSDTLNKGDIGIVKEAVEGSGTVEHRQYTSYVYDGTNWAAMDGNYNAENVYFSDNLTYTAAIGVLPTPSGGSATLAAKGKNVKAVLSSILAKREQPKSATQPAVSLGGTQSSQNVELGTTVSKSGTFTSSLSAGSYTYGPDTGITASSWSHEIKYSSGKSGSIASGTTSSTAYSYSFVMGADGNQVNVNFKATAAHGAGPVAVDNLGDPSDPVVQIAAGNKSNNSTAEYKATYNSYYYGELNTIQDASYFDTADTAFNTIRKNTTYNHIGQPTTFTMHSGYKTLYLISIDGKKVTKLFNNTTFDDWTAQLSPVTTITVGCADSTSSSKGNYSKTYNIQLLKLPDGAAKDYSLTATIGNE